MSYQASENLLTNPFIMGQNGIGSHKPSTILQDAARSTALARFTVLGKKKYTVPTSGVVVGTGTGTCTAVSADGTKNLKIGAYVLECIVAVAHGGIFKLTDPDGIIVASSIEMVAGDGVASVLNAGGLNFTLTDATDFIVGDTITITTVAVGKYYPLKGDDVLGLAEVAGIYFGDTITAAALVAADVTYKEVLLSGYVVDKNQLVFENSLTLASVLPSGKTVEEELRALGILCADTVDITGYENS